MNRGTIVLKGILRLTIAIACVLVGSVLLDARVAVLRSSARQQGAMRDLDITFERQTRTVTIRVSLEDPYGHFIPKLRREHFAVYEDGVKQTNATVDIEHASITLTVLLERGGHYQQLNAFLHREGPIVVRPLLDRLGDEDKLAVFAYTDHVETLLAFDQPVSALDAVLHRLKEPGFSEANLYDALIDVLTRMKVVSGRKAVLLISTGLDTFSHARFDDVLRAAQQSATPVYCIGLAASARGLLGTSGPLARIDWTRAENQLEVVAKVSGGRAYLRDLTTDVSAVYDDMMEHLRVRYVIRYVSSNPASTGRPRSVRIALVNPDTGAPLRIVDDAGKVIATNVVAQGSYTP
jgi:Ca-activated chloride channel homolog